MQPVRQRGTWNEEKIHTHVYLTLSSLWVHEGGGAVREQKIQRVNTGEVKVVQCSHWYLATPLFCITHGHVLSGRNNHVDSCFCEIRFKISSLLLWSWTVRLEGWLLERRRFKSRSNVLFVFVNLFMHILFRLLVLRCGF